MTVPAFTVERQVGAALLRYQIEKGIATTGGAVAHILIAYLAEHRYFQRSLLKLATEMQSYVNAFPVACSQIEY